MTNITPEMIEKAKTTKTVEELLALAKENNVAMTEEEANTYFAQLHPISGEIIDDELANVAGGGCGCPEGYEVTTVGDKCTAFVCKKCGHAIETTLYGFQKCNCGGLVVCDACKYCEYKNALWLCNRTRVMQDIYASYKK